VRSRDIKRRQGLGKWRRAKNFYIPKLNLPRLNLPTIKLKKIAKRLPRLRLPMGPAKGRRGALSVKEMFFRLCVVATVIVMCVLAWRLLRPGITVRVHPDTVAAFRVPHQTIGLLESYAAAHNISFPTLLAVFHAENDFFPQKSATFDVSKLEATYIANFQYLLRRYNSRSLSPYIDMFYNLFSEIEAFPIPTGWYDHGQDASVLFGNSWGVTHNFQGNRTHMGAAIIDRENIRGRVPIVSMTAGQATRAGWDNQLGYFVEVTTGNGSRYLYAHLDSIAAGLATGQHIAAGQLLGHMGNSGGGRGSRSFPVHLHLAISPRVRFTRGDFWINPYPLLRYLDAKS
jgi:murein DD-endopeptidase MepM/ murein hydrolase activator NlpD